MALAVDATSSGSTAGATSLTISHTVSGSDRLIYAAFAGARNGAGDTLSATYNGVAMTQVASVNNQFASTLSVRIFRLIAPDTGTHDIVITTTGAFVGGGAGISFTGGNQTTPEGTAATASNISSPATVNVSSASDEIVIDAVDWNGTAAQTVGAGQTGVLDAQPGSRREGASYETGAGTTTMSWTSTNTVWTIAAIPVKPAAVAKVLDADAGSYALSGQTAALEHDRQVAAAAGSYLLSGQVATLTRDLPLVAGTGSYALTGQTALLEHDKLIDAAAGSYALTGQDATLTKGLAVSAEAGSYAVTGQDATFNRTYAVDANAGSYAVTGQDAALEFDRQIIADAGSYAVTGQNATLNYTPAGGGTKPPFMLGGTDEGRAGIIMGLHGIEIGHA